MNKQITKVALFISLIGSVFVSKAQTAYKDYVITTTGDSIRCKVEKPLIGKPKFQSETMAKPEKITLENVKEYSMKEGKNAYRAVCRGNKPEFMTIIEKGIIGIYEVVQTNSYGSMGANGQWSSTSTSTTDWYFGKKTDTVVALKTSGFVIFGKSRQKRKDLLGEMLKDKPEIYQKYIAEDKFSFNQIRALIHLYNTGQELQEKK